MPADATLHGNGICCPACELRRESRDPMDETPVPCNTCGGTGRVGHSDHDIIRTSTAWAKEHYWPERIRRWELQNQTG